MASFDIVVARSKFNFPTQINKFLENGIVTLQYFETHGDFKSPKKFKMLLDNQGRIQEHIVELKINEENNTYYPHYLGLVFNSSNVILSIIGLTDLIEEGNDSISYCIIFENNDSDGGREGFPIKNVDTKLKTKKIELV